MAFKGKGIAAVGRRKSAVARVYLREGEGKFIVNKRPVDEYFGRETLRMIVNRPLVISKGLDKYDVIVSVQGGGIAGQAGAVRHGLSRALTLENSELRPPLKSEGLLTRDARCVERKKYGRHKARKKPQFSKR